MAKEHAPEIPVRFYRTEAGTEPALEWLRGLAKEDRRVIGSDLMRVQFWMAHRNAFGSKPKGWPLGSTLNAAEPADCTADLVFPSGHVSRAPWLYQEDPEDAGRGPCACEAPDERGDEMKKRNPHIGSALNDFLKEEGILEETRTAALKEALAWQVQKAMKKAKINKVQMARRMHTSRAALDRLLNPGNASVTLQTLCKAARAVGRDLRIELV